MALKYILHINLGNDKPGLYMLSIDIVNTIKH